MKKKKKIVMPMSRKQKLKIKKVLTSNFHIIKYPKIRNHLEYIIKNSTKISKIYVTIIKAKGDKH